MFSPFQDLLYSLSNFNSTLVFVVIFLVFFGLTYTALSRFFFSRKNGQASNNGAAIVTSACISLLAAAGIIQNNWIFTNFGSIVSIFAWILPLFIIVAFIFAIFKKLREHNNGKIPLIILAIAIWGIFRYLIYYTGMLDAVPSQAAEWLRILANVGLIIVVVLLILIFAGRKR